jgi:hypothetical protein
MLSKQRSYLLKISRIKILKFYFDKQTSTPIFAVPKAREFSSTGSEHPDFTSGESPGQ